MKLYYNSSDSVTDTVKTYSDMIALLESNPNQVFVPILYVNDRIEWFAIDRVEYLRQIKGISNPQFPFPCMIEIEPDGEIFFHPKVNNPV